MNVSNINSSDAPPDFTIIDYENVYKTWQLNEPNERSEVS